MEETGIPPQKRRHGYTEQEITRRLIEAIFEQRLPPGERITENQLADIFGVSRTVVRLSMSKLSEIGVFRKTPNLGYTIASPSRAEARMMLDVRKMIEPSMVRSIAVTRSAEHLQSLLDHIATEEAARSAGDRSTLVRLTGEFHLKLAEISGNVYLVHIMTQLQVLTCLAILVHAESETGCPRDEHSSIVNAIAQGDGEKAAAEMAHHLSHISEELQINTLRPEPSLESALRWLGAAQ
ncbi:GntR family transcriptional regulator [Paracoccus yeei]|uniref:GntR family transcriptional regulator n=1 Tax=Paracoccus yeei TaxID=147645 RepID=A0A2D2C387_9RHOB|nr:GntR family transcriptional regulator [Paracoccus yeei]ATQ56889.1 GntR family transcriptional regulator [Paracoccus yeei]